MEFHDLNTHDKPTMDTKTSLGLGSKLCMQQRGMEWNNTNRMIDNDKKDVRLKDYLRKYFYDNDEIPSLCRKNERWKSLKAIRPIED